jgi:hypothetical protein
MLMKKGIKGTIFQVPVGAEIVKHEYYFYILLLYFFQGIFTEGRLYRAHGHIGIRVYGHMGTLAYGYTGTWAYGRIGLWHIGIFIFTKIDLPICGPFIGSLASCRG